MLPQAYSGSSTRGLSVQNHHKCSPLQACPVTVAPMQLLYGLVQQPSAMGSFLDGLSFQGLRQPPPISENHSKSPLCVCAVCMRACVLCVCMCVCCVCVRARACMCVKFVNIRILS